jgi:small subunit ribosomal protein S16
VNASKRRDALPLEKLGEYDPIPRPAPPTTTLAAAIAQSFHLDSKGRDAAMKEVREKRIVWDVERVRYWLGVGAQPSEAVVKLLERVSLLLRLWLGSRSSARGVARRTCKDRSC